MTCHWVWSWQEAGNFGDFIGGVSTVVALYFAVREYMKRGDDERKKQARQIEVRAMSTRQLRAFNNSDRYVDRTEWYLPFKPEGERLVWAYAVDRGDLGGQPLGIQSDRNVIEAGSEAEHILGEGEPSEGCYLIFRDSAWRWWRAGIDGTLSKYEPSGQEKAGPPPEDAPTERAERRRAEQQRDRQRPLTPPQAPDPLA